MPGGKLGLVAPTRYGDGCYDWTEPAPPGYFASLTIWTGDTPDDDDWSDDEEE